MPTLAPPVATGRTSPTVCARAPPRSATRPFRNQRSAPSATARRSPSTARAVVRSASDAIDHARRPCAGSGPHPMPTRTSRSLSSAQRAGVPRRCGKVPDRQADPGPADVRHHAQVRVELRLARDVQVVDRIERTVRIDCRERRPFSAGSDHPQRGPDDHRVADRLHQRDAEVPGAGPLSGHRRIRVVSDAGVGPCRGRFRTAGPEPIVADAELLAAHRQHSHCGSATPAWACPRTSGHSSTVPGLQRSSSRQKWGWWQFLPDSSTSPLHHRPPRRTPRPYPGRGHPRVRSPARPRRAVKKRAAGGCRREAGTDERIEVAACEGTGF